MNIESEQHPEASLIKAYAVLAEAPADRQALEDEEVREAFGMRNVETNDFEVVAKLAAVNKNDLIANYHNFFTSKSKDRCLYTIRATLAQHEAELARIKLTGNQREISKAQELVYMDAAVLILTTKYDTYGADHIRYALESYRPPR